jgi:hypothetical protein
MRKAPKLDLRELAIYVISVKLREIDPGNSLDAARPSEALPRVC